VTGFFVSMGIVVLGGGLGYYLDTKGFIKEPSHFWFMGLVTALVATYVGTQL